MQTFNLAEGTPVRAVDKQTADAKLATGLTIRCAGAGVPLTTVALLSWPLQDTDSVAMFNPTQEG